ncbi:MAG: peptidase associated/transthyretin-like domain-containing protein, partial [Gemmatimonadaceae bacterium]
MATAFAILLLPAALAAQAGGTVAGQVLDAASQAPVEGVQVMIVGTQRGTTTNAQCQHRFGIAHFHRPELHTLGGAGEAGQGAWTSLGREADRGGGGAPPG